VTEHRWVKYHAPDDPELETVIWCLSCGLHKVEFESQDCPGSASKTVAEQERVRLVEAEKRIKDLEEMLKNEGEASKFLFDKAEELDKENKLLKEVAKSGDEERERIESRLLRMFKDRPITEGALLKDLLKVVRDEKEK
jgi:predicted  nucleic acid-binding Zn-ribbon protein